MERSYRRSSIQSSQGRYGFSSRSRQGEEEDCGDRGLGTTWAGTESTPQRCSWQKRRVIISNLDFTKTEDFDRTRTYLAFSICGAIPLALYKQF